MKMRKKSLLIIGIGVCFFLALTLIDTMYRSKEDAGLMMVSHIQQLKKTLEKIHHDCGIIDFDAQKNPVNFLNVTQFVGSEVGPMNLMHPKKWQGPYMPDNPTIYHVVYQVVSTNNGYFITPGDGVVLPNKKVIGKDIVLNKKADIAAMINNQDMLSYKGKPLAAYLDFGSSAKTQFFLTEEGNGV